MLKTVSLPRCKILLGLLKRTMQLAPHLAMGMLLRLFHVCVVKLNAWICEVKRISNQSRQLFLEWTNCKQNWILIHIKNGNAFSTKLWCKLKPCMHVFCKSFKKSFAEALNSNLPVENKSSYLKPRKCFFLECCFLGTESISQAFWIKYLNTILLTARSTTKNN